MLDAIQSEVNIIMDPIGYHLEWRALAAARGDEAVAQLAVVTFKGRCDTATLLPRSANPGALGWTHISNGEILPFSDIDCNGVRTFLQTGLLTFPSQERDEAYGRAVGRVLAHELFHIFANTIHHGTSGVAKAAYSAYDLLSNTFVFEDTSSEKLKAGQPRPAMDTAEASN